MSVLDEIVKAYDIRGTVPDQLNAEVARALGVAFAQRVTADQVLVARDMRPSGPELVAAFSDGVLAQGIDVIDIGLASSDLLYFASGSRQMPGVIFTASHNPAEYNGAKMCLAGAKPIDLADIQPLAQAVLDGAGPAPAARAGTRTEENLLPKFVDHVVSFIDVDSLRPRRVVADTANGMGGLVVPAVFERLGAFELEVMYGELDGTFPNHPADPLQPANQRDLRARVVAGGFDVGLAFDGDADRVFVVDETGTGLSGSTTTAILSAVTLRANPGASILYNLICSKAVPEVIRNTAAYRFELGSGIRSSSSAWPTPARCSVGSTRRTTTSRRTTGPTPASSQRCRSWPNSRAPTTCCRSCGCRSSVTRRAARSTLTSVTSTRSSLE